MDLPKFLPISTSELDTYPPRIVCHFDPNPHSQHIQRTSCTLTFQGLSRPVTFTFPLFISKVCEQLSDDMCLFNEYCQYSRDFTVQLYPLYSRYPCGMTVSRSKRYYDFSSIFIPYKLCHRSFLKCS